MNTKMDQIKIMLELQNQINSKVNPLWKQANQAWQRAIWIESGEMLEHFGWKWWKKQTPDMEQVHLELIDIWHFGLSMMVEQYSASHHPLLAFAAAATEVSETLDLFAAAKSFDNNYIRTFPSLIEDFVVSTITSPTFHVYKFIQLMDAVELSFDKLYVMYVSKNVLNNFRQDNGYKDGSYVKIWNGLEDNEVLVEIVKQLDSSDPQFPHNISLELTNRYQQNK
jgi:dimeric dUTPase (all-alpha-NTP-PPase superfamily)